MSFIAIIMLFVYKRCNFLARMETHMKQESQTVELITYWSKFQMLIILLLRTDNINEVILEVHAGVGGLEAGLFAAEMFRMYQRWVSLGHDN